MRKQIDLTTLPGWANLSTGNHTIKIKAKGTGYRESELSAGVTVSKAASIPALADATWEQINQVSQAGTASNYWAVGDEKTFTLSTGEAVTVQILGFNHDDLADGSGKAGITFGMKNLLTTGYPTNSSNTNVGGWDSSYARTSIMPTFLGQLPSDLQNVIKEVNKKTSQGNRSSLIITSVDKLFLLSHIELMGTNKYKTDADAVLSAQGEGVQYDYYKNAIIPTPVLGSNKFTALSGNTGTFYTPNTSNASSYINSFGETKTTAANFYYNYNNAKSSGNRATAGAWGLRSPYLDSSEYFAYVNADGNVSSMKASNPNCRWFGFCV